MKGWMGKILRVDLTNNKVSLEDLDPKIAKDYIGGRGLAVRYMFDEVDPKVDPLNPDNKLLFATGPETGTNVVGGVRYMVVTTSPLSGSIACANSGGFWGPELKFAGYDMVILEGRAKEPVYLWIEDERVEIRPAAKIWGKTTSETQESIRGETNKEAQIACIGPAGERLVRFACIIHGEGKAAGRSGVGAVMGSKNLKAVAVRGTKMVPVADEPALKDIRRRVIRRVKGTPLDLLGTAASPAKVNRAGALPTRNWQTGIFEGAEEISGHREESSPVKIPCYRCPVACRRRVKVSHPVFGFEGPGPDYEGLATLGSACGVCNQLAVIKACYLCDELGMDVISCGGTIACAMEMFEKGFLSEKDVGMKLNFGNAGALVEMVRKIGYRDGFGHVLAEGSYRFAERYGHPELSMSVKKKELPGYDPRAVQGFALGFATANSGASHTQGDTGNPEISKMPYAVDPLVARGKASLVIEFQDEQCSIDSAGLCMFCSFYKIGKMDELAELEAVTGAGYDWSKYMTAGERIWNLERLFNLRAGFTAKDDTLPARFLKEPMPEGPAKGLVAKLDEMLPEYYVLRGWDRWGRPAEEKLKELGLTLAGQL